MAKIELESLIAETHAGCDDIEAAARAMLLEMLASETALILEA